MHDDKQYTSNSELSEKKKCKKENPSDCPVRKTEFQPQCVIKCHNKE